MRPPEILVQGIMRVQPKLERDAILHHLPRWTSRQVRKLLDDPRLQEAMQKILQEQLNGFVEWVEMLNVDRNRQYLVDKQLWGKMMTDYRGEDGE